MLKYKYLGTKDLIDGTQTEVSPWFYALQQLHARFEDTAWRQKSEGIFTHRICFMNIFREYIL